MEERERPTPPEPPARTEGPKEAPEETTGGTGTLPSEGVPNPGFTTRGD